MPKSKLSPLKIPSDPAVLGYLAGLFDGEGSVSIGAAKPTSVRHSVSHRLAVNISNNDEAVILWLRAELGGTVFITPPRTPRQNTSYRWVVQGVNAIPFLEAILSYSRVKPDRIVIALRFLALPLSPTGSKKGRTGTAPLDPALVEQREACRQQLMERNRRNNGRMLRWISPTACAS